MTVESIYDDKLLLPLLAVCGDQPFNPAELSKTGLKGLFLGGLHNDPTSMANALEKSGNIGQLWDDLAFGESELGYYEGEGFNGPVAFLEDDKMTFEKDWYKVSTINTGAWGRCLLFDIVEPMGPMWKAQITLKYNHSKSSVNAHLLSRGSLPEFVVARFTRLVESFYISSGEQVTISIKKNVMTSLNRPWVEGASCNEDKKLKRYFITA